MNLLPLHFSLRNKLIEGWGYLPSSHVSPRDQGEVRCCDHPREFTVGGQTGGLYFKGSITATTCKVTQPLSSEDHLHNVVDSVRTAPIHISTL